jgi:nucleotide-binding universal stress UspA family protein
MKMQRLLVATDTSRASEVAVDQAAALAAHLGAELVLMYVGTGPEHARDLPAVFATSAEMERLSKEMFRHDRRVIDTLASSASELGIKVVQHVVSGEPAHAICEAARDLEADLVVTGTHGRTGIDRFLIGSVAERVVRSSPVPVMVARSHGEIDQPPEANLDRGPLGGALPSAGYRKILVPTDFSDHAGRATELALTVGAEGCEIELFHCWRLPAGIGAGPSSVVQPIVRSVEREVAARGQAAIKSWGDRGANMTFHSVRKPPVQGVADRIATADIDLVVMGTHGRGALSRLILGSVSSATVHQAPCSVIVVPPER